MARTLWLSMAAMPAVAMAGNGGGVDLDLQFKGEGTSYVLGQVSSGNCNFMYDPGVKTNYAALNDKQWEKTNNCGRCAEVSCDDDKCPDKSKSSVVYLVDRCPECKHGDLDLSPEVFKYITGSDPARYKIKWKFVDCPVTGNIQYCTKSGSSKSWLAIQPANFANGVRSMKIANQEVTMVDSCYYFLLNNGVNVDMSAVDIELTSVSGEKITEKLSLTSDVCTAGTSNFGASTTQESVSQTSPVEQTSPTAPAPKMAPATVHPAPTPAPAPPAPAPAPPAPAPAPPAPAPVPAPVPVPATPTIEKTPPSLLNFGTGNPPQPSNQPPVNQPARVQPPNYSAQVQPPFQPPQRPPQVQPVKQSQVQEQLFPQKQPPVEYTNQVEQEQQNEATDFNALETKPGANGQNVVAGEVVPADESRKKVSILQADAFEVDKTTPVKQVNMKSEDSSSGTSPVIVTLVVLAVVGGIALAAVAYVVKKKKRNDKSGDRDEALMRAFDTFSSPVHFEKTIAKI
uniref:Expansin-like EG45 domain-containing protein n=1 Tax=Peronospora matthiolae TaxID=2874970 RepID=A0AAV1UUF9_9STRA